MTTKDYPPNNLTKKELVEMALKLEAESKVRKQKIAQMEAEMAEALPIQIKNDNKIIDTKNEPDKIDHPTSPETKKESTKEKNDRELRENYYDKAVKIVRETGNVTFTNLERKLGIRTRQAKRLLEMLKEGGVIKNEEKPQEKTAEEVRKELEDSYPPEEQSKNGQEEPNPIFEPVEEEKPLTLDEVNKQIEELQKLIKDNKWSLKFWKKQERKNRLGYLQAKKIESEEILSDRKESEEKSNQEEESSGLTKGIEGEVIQPEVEESEMENKKTKKSFWSFLRKNKKTDEQEEVEPQAEGVEEVDQRVDESEKDDYEKIEKQKIRDNLLAKIEERKGVRMEGNSFYKRINKGLDGWENWGRGEKDKGWRGFSKRFTKTAINLALIGAIASFSVELAAKMGAGTTTALAGGSTSYIGKKLLFGLGMSSLMELGGNKMSPNRRKFIQYSMLIGTIGVGAILSGGLAVPAAAGVGMLTSMILKRQYSAEKTQKAREKKMGKLLDKYSPETASEKAKEIEDEILEKIGKWEERRKFWGKIARGMTAIGTSIGTLEALGAEQDVKNMDLNNLGGDDGKPAPEADQSSGDGNVYTHMAVFIQSIICLENDSIYA